MCVCVWRGGGGDYIGVHLCIFGRFVAGTAAAGCPAG